MIYRLNIQRLDGIIDVDARLAELRQAVRGVDGVVPYAEGATDGWGAPFPDGCSIDFDLEDVRESDREVLRLVRDFFVNGVTT